MAEKSSHGITPHGSPYSYPRKGSKATPAFSDTNAPLLDKIKRAIQASGAISFRDYMAMALYDPDYGYYTARSERVGKQGDFITSVSVGRCFGLILARRLTDYWEECGKPSDFHIIEPGAHTGALCEDILKEIQSSSEEFFNSIHYHLIETTPALMEAQGERLDSAFRGKYTIHQTLSDLNPCHGALLSNELIDAFPVDLIRFDGHQWSPLNVTETEDGLSFVNASWDHPELEAFCNSLGNTYPKGYTTEYNSGITRFVSQASAALTSGLFITIDYGHLAEDYYHPDRSSGTLQTYHHHQKSDDPLCHPGEIDITSHVDFSRLILAAESAGFHSPELVTQASYLTNHAKNWLLSLENATSPQSLTEAPALLRQFQTLTHPSMLGTKFMVLEMMK